MRRVGERAVILVCDGRGREKHGLDETLTTLSKLAPGVLVSPVRGLCVGSRAASVTLRQHSGDFVVLLPCRSHGDRLHTDALRERAENASVSRDRLVVIDPADLLADDPAQAVKLDAVAACAAALTGPSISGAFNGAVSMPTGIGRRALLTGRLRARRPMPRLQLEPCADPLCHLCVDSCPTSALRMDGGLPIIAENDCDSCGACVSACPHDVLRIDTVPRPAWEAYLRHVLAAARDMSLPLGIWWSCADVEERTNLEPGVGWLRLRMPCLRGLTPAWVLQPLAAGVKAVTWSACPAAEGTWGQNGPMSQFLRAIASIGSGQPPFSELMTLREPAGTVEALSGLISRDAGFVPCDSASLGVVSCVPQACTSCGLCAERCPTRALEATTATSTWTLEFSHGSCVACGSCVAGCPEHALTLRRGIEPAGLRKARELVCVTVRRCAACGELLAAPGLAARLASAGVNVPDDGICGDCRAAGKRTTHISALVTESASASRAQADPIEVVGQRRSSGSGVSWWPGTGSNCRPSAFQRTSSGTAREPATCGNALEEPVV